PLAPKKVYAAWSGAAQNARWHFPGDDGWELAEFDQDFRVGGHERSRFGPKGAPHLREEGRFLDIVPNERIVSAGTMHDHDLLISITLCTVELAADGDGTLLKLTDQSAFFSWETKKDRTNGWGQILSRLGAALGESDSR